MLGYNCKNRDCREYGGACFGRRAERRLRKVVAEWQVKLTIAAAGMAAEWRVWKTTFASSEVVLTDA